MLSRFTGTAVAHRGEHVQDEVLKERGTSLPDPVEHLSGDTKTPMSRRTLALPDRAVASLRKRIGVRDADRAAAGEVWEEHGLVFCNGIGRPLSAAVVRHEFQNITEAAGIGRGWTPRELRHSFVSLMSDSGMPVEEIARLVGHSSSRTTEVIYRRELRPVLQSGARVMDQILAAKPRRRVVRRRNSGQDSAPGSGREELRTNSSPGPISSR